jgi:hypothetical protein
MGKKQSKVLQNGKVGVFSLGKLNQRMPMFGKIIRHYWLME